MWKENEALDTRRLPAAATWAEQAHAAGCLMRLQSPQISLAECLPVSAKINQLSEGQFFSLLMQSWLILTGSRWESACKSCAYPSDLRGKWQPVQADFFLSYANTTPLNHHWVKEEISTMFSRSITKVAHIYLSIYLSVYLNIYKMTCIFIERAYMTTRERLFVGLVHDNRYLE